eukprot:TRINITY_DN29081_c0_g1_i1.p2 TRINITY_DN29081_c0_g1~~TRINITY_DN29081_c0_g1_i1.p2  ORF type:complete len:150 (-),score=23.28 TRINITY_DN29081_c0_g1_i1:168-617(-)
MKDTRVTYRRRTSYHTRSNLVRVVKTPGGKLTIHKRVKRVAVPKCGDCHSTLQGLRALTASERHRASRREKTVSRAYGGSRCAKCVRERIVRAFLIEEQKIVKRVLKAAKKKAGRSAGKPRSGKIRKSAKKAGKTGAKKVAGKSAPKRK